MSINLDAIMAVNLSDKATSQELDKAVDMSSHEEMGGCSEVAEDVSSFNDNCVSGSIAQSICFLKKTDAVKAVKLLRLRSNQRVRDNDDKVHQKISQDEDLTDVILKGNKIRKYTKEMQNRDVILHKARKMRKRAALTASNLDDKFAIAAMAPTKRFDNIVYSSATTDDAAELLDDVFEAVVADSE